MARSRRLATVCSLIAGAALAVGVLQAVPVSAAAQASARPTSDLGPLVHGRSKPAHPTAPARIPTVAVPSRHLPAAGSYSITLPTSISTGRGQLAPDPAAPNWQSVGATGLAVGRGSHDDGRTAEQVAIRVLAADAARKLGTDGLAIQLSRASVGGNQVAVRVPAAVTDGVYGADYASRIRWVQVPAGTSDAALATGKVRPTAVRVTKQPDGSTVLSPTVSRQATVLMASAGPVSDSGAGTWAATSLSSASSWQTDVQGGSFDWNYPFTMPPAAAGPSPNLSLSYNSGSVDGETASTNNQSSVVGDGWQLAGAGFIERSYLPCAKDGSNLPAEQAQSGDLCWAGDHDTISFAGHAGPLVPTVTAGEYRIQGDDGTRVRYLPHSGTCGDGGADNGCWQLTTRDGTIFFFGRNSKSAWTVPVYGDDSGDECYHATGTDFAHSACTQVWRWNLDRVVDIHGNAENLTYASETNYYHQDNGALASYIRGGYLTQIDYDIASGSTVVGDQVVLGYASTGRCNTGGSGADCSLAADGKANSPQSYPDVPWDQYCAAGEACTGLITPTFFTDALLTSVTTKALVSGALTTVDTWTFGHSFVDPGDTSAASLWLASISRPGLSDTTFKPIALTNRVLNDQFLPLEKQRIEKITLNTGAIILVDYDLPECDSTTIAGLDPATNSHQCFPQWWTPTGASPRLDWFNKYRVKDVSDDPNTGNADDMPLTTSYIYTSNPAWRLDMSSATVDDNRTWSSFAGYSTVEVRAGDSNDATAEHTTDYRYFQGLDGDPDGTASSHYRSVALTAGSVSVADSLWFAGRTFETITRLGANGGTTTASTTTVLTDTVDQPWAQSSATHQQSVSFPNPDPNGTGTLSATVDTGAYLTGDDTSTATSTTSAGGSDVVTTTNTHDGYGRTTSSQIATTDAGTTCTTTSYADNTTAWLLDLPARVATAGAACGTTPSYPHDAVNDTRYFYDGASASTGQTPSLGNLTRTDVVKDYNGSGGSAETVTTAQTPNDSTGYDALGRRLKSTDVNGAATTTSFTPAGSGPVTGTTSTTTPPASQASLPAMTTTSVFDPRWGTPTSITDPNGNLTTASYDSLGRLSSVWLPDRPLSTDKTAHTGTASIAYSYIDTSGIPLETTTTTLNATGGTIARYDFADALGRPIQSQIAMDSVDSVTNNHFIGGTVLTDTYYDHAGQVWLVNNAYGNPDVMPSETYYNPTTQTQYPSQTQTTWDGAGRMTSDILDGVRADNSYGKLWSTDYSYVGVDRTDTTPPAGGTPSTVYTDSLGRTKYLDQYSASTPTGTAQRTSYSYDARGDLTGMTDPAAHSWSWTYDPRGLLVGTVDPDSGTRTNGYDDAGNLHEVDDGGTGGSKLQYGYDAYNRRTKETEYQSAAAGWAQVASWGYDAATAGKGLLSSAVSYVGSTPTTLGTAYTKNTLKYDPNGKPLSSNVVVPNWNGGTLTDSTTLTYDSAGNLSTYSDQNLGGLGVERPSFTYDPLGNLTALTGNSGLLGRVEYSHINLPIKLVFSNGTTTLNRLNYYDDATNRLTRTNTTTNASTNFLVADHTYAYTNSGLVTSDSNTAAGQATDTQCYSYDHFQELTAAWTPANNVCATPGTIGGPAPYYQTYGYDTKTGNRTYLDKHSTTGTGSDTRISDSYAATGTPTPPHLLSQTNTATAPIGTSPDSGAGWSAGTNASYTYDQDGQTKTRPSGQSLTWNSQNQLTQVTIGTATVSNIYDADGNLLEQTDSSGSTLYLGDTELHHATGSTTVTGVRTYSVNGTPIAERSTTPASPTTSKLYWLNASALGQNTVDDEIDASTLAITHRYSDPFGNPRGSTPAWTSTHGFLNAPTSSTLGTTHLGARDYDPTLGRFLSDDPKLDATSPQQVNGYSYASDQPVTQNDATGLMVDDPSSNRCDSACHHGVVAEDPITYQLDPSTSSGGPSTNNSPAALTNIGDGSSTPKAPHRPFWRNFLAGFDAPSQFNVTTMLTSAAQMQDGYNIEHGIPTDSSAAAAQAANNIYDCTDLIACTLGGAADGALTPGGAAEATSLEIVQAATDRVTARGTEALVDSMSDRQQAAYARVPQLRKAFLGSAIHKAVAKDLTDRYPNRFVYNTIGPDFLDTETNQWIELTTTRDVANHQARPGYSIVTGYATYTLP